MLAFPLKVQVLDREFINQVYISNKLHNDNNHCNGRLSVGAIAHQCWSPGVEAEENVMPNSPSSSSPERLLQKRRPGSLWRNGKCCNFCRRLYGLFLMTNGNWWRSWNYSGHLNMSSQDDVGLPVNYHSLPTAILKLPISTAFVINCWLCFSLRHCASKCMKNTFIYLFTSFLHRYTILNAILSKENKTLIKKLHLLKNIILEILMCKFPEKNWGKR